MKREILIWKEDDNAFVETHNFQTMLKKVRNQPFVTFVGVPGSGKTATARHIALILEAEGYEILPIKEIRNIETYCDSNSPQVCLIDDVLGVFGLNMNMFNMLTRYQDKIINPTMSKFKILMTCREAIYEKEDISQIFLSKEENVVHLHSEENALSCEDKNAILAKYDIDLKVLSSISNAQTSPMFPFLCKLFSRNKSMFEVYGPNFFLSPVPVILQQFDAKKVTNKIQYASLVLLMVNQNALLEENLTNESTYKGKFYEKRICVFRHCKISPTTKGFNIIDALEEMEGTFVRKSGSRFMFLHESLFHITGYHFGCQFPEIILKYMDSDYIANYIKLNSKMDGEWGKDIPVDLEIDLCIRLRESNYPMFAERLFRDVCDGEMYNVFTNEALKHPLVIKAFINVMNCKSYIELYAIFLVDLQQMSKDRLKFQCQRCQKNQMVKLHLQLMDAHSGGIFRAISWAISFGHHHVLQFITDQILIHTGNITDLFEISYKKDGRRFSDVKQKEKQTSVDIIMEQCQLLCLGCCSGDLNTVQILLKYVDKDAINNTVIHAKHVYLNIKPLVVACTLGYLDIAKELVKAGADVSLRDALDSPLTAARKEGHLNIVEWLRKSGADATL